MGMTPWEKPYSSACLSSGYSPIRQHTAYFHLVGHPHPAMSMPGM